MRLRTKYALIFLGLMLVLGSVLFTSTEQFERELIDQEQREVNRTATLTARQIDKSIRESRDNIRRVGFDPDVDSRAKAIQRLPPLLNSTDYLSAQVIHPNGTIVAFEGTDQLNETRRRAAIGKNVSDREYVQQLQRPFRSTYISAPEQDDRGLTIIKIGSEITGRNETGASVVKGYLVVAIDLNVSGFFGPKEPLETRSQTVKIVGRNENGTTLVLDPASRSFDQTIASTATIEATGWELTVRRDRSRLTERLGTLRAVQSAGLGMVFLSFVLLGVWEYRNNLQQMRRLLDGFAELESGNYDHEVELEAAEEWRQMSEGFNELADGLERREEQIREREQQLSVVNRVLRHNLKNEMTVIQGHAEMLPMLDSREQREDTLETISETAKRLLSHSQKARHIDSAIESAKEGRKPVNCTHVVEKVCQSVSDDYPDVELETEVPEDTYVEAIGALEYGVRSIVENAFEHNDNEDPWVRVWTETTDGTVELSVADNGPGIPAHEIEVLERGTETGLEHGSGVGLWLAFWIVKRSEGTLRFIRREPTGTIVTIELPKAEEPDEE